ncbi:hypothetical protein MP228_000408 [Amoeboaphelidium protococcarum]|nr:hypothetical protein MP228_000408 [Amoeboaphelidium protococcarum]
MPPKRSKKSAATDGGKRKVIEDETDDFESDAYSNDDYDSENEDLGTLVPQHATKAIKLKVSAESNGGEDSTGQYMDCTNLPLKPDHEGRPLWISPEANIYLEASSPIVEQAQDFLVAISEPVSRPQFIHEYKLTAYSLYAAVSIGLETENIIQVLSKLCKTPLPPNIEQFIRDNTSNYGKLKLVLKQNRYYIESSHTAILEKLMQDEVIADAIVSRDIEQETQMMLSDQIKIIKKSFGQIESSIQLIQQQSDDTQKGRISGLNQDTDEGQNDASDQEEADSVVQEAHLADDLYDMMVNADDLQDNVDDEDDIDEKNYSFEIIPEKVEIVRRRCNQIDYPLIEEYDFHNDKTLPDLKMDLKPSTIIRSYQEKCLSKMFGNGRARSGIIVLPCGAGKTLVGITAACTVKKSVLVLCTSAVSVEQWRAQFKLWSTINEQKIARFTSDCKEQFVGDAGIVISTYTMIAYSGKRSYDAQKMIDFVRQMEWGFMILDEVHVVPANVFRKVLTTVAAHTKLGLTATLVREDDKITDLNFLIGPKLYEANWLDLSKKGHIATVQCAEVWCPMTAEFYAEYLKASARKRRLLYVMNPNKFRACQFLIQYHEKRGDKIIVFSDDVFALIHYAKTLGKPYIYGPTSQVERMRILQNFQFNPSFNTIFLSKVGDTSIDLPEATCLIQISSHYGSRRQEAQRLGRILRAKRRNDEGFNAYFYSLVSQDTQEMYYSTKRQQFLIDQGYSFKVITGIPPTPQQQQNGVGGVGTQANNDPHLQQIQLDDLVYGQKSDQLKLLNDVLVATDADLKDEDDNVVDDISRLTQSNGSGGGARAAKKTKTNIKSLAGADDMAYLEYSKTQKPKSTFIKKLYQ